MIFLKKLWIVLTISAFAALALAPAFAVAQSQTFGGSSSQTVGGGSSQTFGGGSSQTVGGGSSQTVGGLQNPLGKVTGICQLLKILLNIGILTGIPIAMLFVVLAGFKFILARGNPALLERARMNLYWTLIGIAIFIGIWFLVQVLANTLGALGVQILGDCR